ncbi:MAG: SUMF1/EgtB/PvdO family nonheme iron enzyme [Planctomycetaceae bacterium]
MARLVLPLLLAAAVAAADAEQPLLYLGLNARGAEEWLRVKDGARVIRIPGGEYLRRPYEGGPAIEEPKPFAVASFFLDQCEVTNAQFARFLAAVPSPDGLWREGIPGIVRGTDGFAPAPGLDRHPVTAATGRGALEYARWVGARLPTQVEWEKGGGGAEGNLYPWGDEPPDATRANFGRPHPRGPMPVGSFAAGASPYGCLDMAGNVYDRVLTPARGGELLPVMLKGGSWLSPHPLNLRVLDLCMQPIEVADRSVGFRCAMDDPAPERPVRAASPPPPLRIARDFGAAVKEARERRVPIFLALMLETCGQCDRTREQCFKDARFVAYCNERMVVVIGHQPGDAVLDPHAPLEGGGCPLYAGVSCDEHERLFQEGFEVVGRFAVSPGNFVLHPDRVKRGAGSDAMLIAEAALPKWGDAVEGYLSAFEKAREALR